MEQHLPRAVWKSKGYHQGCCVHEVLQQKRTPLIGNRCIRWRTRTRTSTGQEWFVVPLRWSDWQHSIASHSVCRQKLDWDRNKIHQHRKRGFRHMSQPREIQQYCFAHVVNHITDHKHLVSIFRKKWPTLSQRLKQILLCIHQDQMKIQYKPGLQLCIANWLSRYNHPEGKDEEIRNHGYDSEHQCNWNVHRHPKMHGGSRN